MKLTYLELYNYFKFLNAKYNNFLSEENIFEFIYDDFVYDKTSFVLYSDKLSKNNKQKKANILKSLKKQIPWERVLKYSYFYGEKILLFKKVFSPRLDTEILVNKIIYDHAQKNNELIIYDLGSGTGCLSVVLSKKLKNINLINFEKNLKAYKNTLKNIKFHNLKNIKTIKTNYLKWLQKNEINANIIVCNPPYINKNFNLEINVKKFDPKTALFASDNGLFYYKKIIEIILSKKNKVNYLYFEIGYNQEEMLKEFLINKKINNYSFYKDLNNNSRVLKIKF